MENCGKKQILEIRKKKKQNSVNKRSLAGNFKMYKRRYYIKTKD